MIKHAAEQGTIDIFECDEGMYYAAIKAGAQRIPFLPTRTGVGTSYPDINPELKQFRDPIKDEPMVAVPAIRPDIALLYAGYSDAFGNVQHVGTGYGDRSLYKAADRTIVCVEKVVSNQEIRKDPQKTSVPGADAVVRCPFGAHPFSSPGFYAVDEEHLGEYLEAAGAYVKNSDREPFESYLDTFIREPRDHIEYLERIGMRRLFSLYEF
jgi:glutaconate CoA-transferase subunit A